MNEPVLHHAPKDILITNILEPIDFECMETFSWCAIEKLKAFGGLDVVSPKVLNIWSSLNLLFREHRFEWCHSWARTQVCLNRVEMANSGKQVCGFTRLNLLVGNPTGRVVAVYDEPWINSFWVLNLRLIADISKSTA